MCLLCLSWCKQALIHHQSPGSLISCRNQRKFMCSLNAFTCAAWESSAIGCESKPLHLLFRATEALHSSVSLLLFGVWGWYQRTSMCCVLRTLYFFKHASTRTLSLCELSLTFLRAFIVFTGTCLRLFGRDLFTHVLLHTAWAELLRLPMLIPGGIFP